MYKLWNLECLIFGQMVIRRSAGSQLVNLSNFASQIFQFLPVKYIRFCQSNISNLVLWQAWMQYNDQKQFRGHKNRQAHSLKTWLNHNLTWDNAKRSLALTDQMNFCLRFTDWPSTQKWSSRNSFCVSRTFSLDEDNFGTWPNCKVWSVYLVTKTPKLLSEKEYLV